MNAVGQKQLAVQCRNVAKHYGTGDARVQALNNIELDVYAGELMMLVGPSGCGKTTLISIIAGILDQDQGSCLVYGEDFLAMKAAKKLAFRARNVGFVFQTYNLLPTLTIAENAAVPLIINGVPRKQAVLRASEMLEKVGLGGRQKSLPAQLSGGQQQRVAIVRSLIHGPRLIVCDEPTSALDHETGHKVMELMKTIALDENRALIIVTHDARIFEFADRIARVDDGHIVKIVTSYADL
jgi:putative ABC transport system ATP-binding protein